MLHPNPNVTSNRSGYRFDFATGDVITGVLGVKQIQSKGSTHVHVALAPVSKPIDLAPFLIDAIVGSGLDVK